MKIYHYTSIRSLALILNYKKIRFTRLDLLDDIQEINGLPSGFKSNLFVSCWTEDRAENLALWSLYTDLKGVRIELFQKFYDDHLIGKGDYGNWGYTVDINSPIPLDEIRTDNYFIANSFLEDNGFYVKVKYDNIFSEKKKEHITETAESIIINQVANLVRFKDSIWAFQNESRFYLIAQPLPPLDLFKGDRIEQMKNLQEFKLQNSIRSIDVGIKREVFDNIVVRVHPNCNEADKLIVSSLLRQYTANGKIENSNLDGIYRSK